MLSAIIIAAIAVAIFLGYKTKLNTGLFCIVFAYIIGCLIMGLKPKSSHFFLACEHNVCHPFRIPLL